MTVKIVQIGNSKGIRIPKALLKEAGLEGEVNLRVQGRRVIIEAADPRAGWEEQIKKALAEHGDDIDEWRDWQNMPNEFDEKEWTW